MVFRFGHHRPQTGRVSYQARLERFDID